MSISSITIVKLGGNILDNEEQSSLFLEQFQQLSSPKVLIHGGGAVASEVLRGMGIAPKYVEGRRITDEPTLRVVTMVYAGWINKTLVAKLQASGQPAVGLSGADGQLIVSQKRAVGTIDYGMVGDPQAVHPAVLLRLLEAGFTPVVSPITADAEGQLLNTNADTVAAVIAAELAKHAHTRLYFCSDHKGVLSNIHDLDSVIPNISEDRFAQLKEEGIITGGMIPKIHNALQCKQSGVQEVVICGVASLTDKQRATVFE